MMPDHAASATQSSPLLDLPPEMRNLIYREVLIQDGPIEISSSEEDIKAITSMIQLLHVCGQVRKEAHDIFWSENTFRITARDLEFCRAIDWLKSVGYDRVALITKVELKVQPIESSDPTSMLHNLTQYNSISLDYKKTSYFIRALVVLFVSVPSIKIKEPPTLESSASDARRLFAQCHAEFNQKVKSITQESTLDLHGRWIHHDKIRTTIRNFTFGSLHLEIEDEDIKTQDMLIGYLNDGF